MNAIIYGFGVIATIGASGILVLYLEDVRKKWKESKAEVKKLESEWEAMQRFSAGLNTEFLVTIEQTDKKDSEK